MKKNYILDTNVLIHDPQSIFQFEDNNLYIPIYVLEELDKLKGEMGSSRGRNARESCKLLDELRSQGSLSDGIDINDYGKLTIYVPKERKSISVALDHHNVDGAILQCAQEIKDSTKEERTILVTMDVNLRVRAESLGLQTASYESQAVDTSKLITGHSTMIVEDGAINTLYQNDYLDCKQDDLYHNQCLMLQEPSGKTSLGKYKNGRIYPIKLPKEGIMGIKPRNIEQQFVLELLLDDDVKVLTLSGIPGSGKTLLSLAAGLSKTVVEGKYNKMAISRPIVPMGGKDTLGFLPGSLDEKLEPWIQPIYDNLELLMMTGGKKKTNMKYDELFQQDIIKIEPLNYIRGRSLPNQFIIIDEAQNISLHELKTIITRCGEGSKIVLNGDPDQIDSPYLDKGTCGLSVAIERLHNNKMVGHFTLSKGERSELANLAAAVL